MKGPIQDIFNFKTEFSGYYIELEIGLYLIAQILWYAPLIIARWNHGPFWLYFEVDNQTEEKIENPLIQNADYDQNNDNKVEEIVEDIGLPAIFKTIDFWLLYLPFIIIAGSGLILIANAAQIIESAESSKNNDDTNDGVTTSLVTIISCGSFLGRIIAGTLSDKYIDKYHRVFWNIFSALGMCFSTFYIFMIGFLFDGNSDLTVSLLLFGAFITGMSYGWIFSVTLASVCDLWGTKYLSGNYGVFDTCGAIGQLIFSNGVFATFYQYQGRNKENDGNKCYGNKCFQ